MTDTETRAAILDRTIAKFRSAGIPVDNDPILHDWLAAWVGGGLKMSDIALRYQDLLKTRLALKQAPAAAEGVANAAPDDHTFMDQHQLLEEVARLLAETPIDSN
jgi:hypothetical protein